MVFIFNLYDPRTGDIVMVLLPAERGTRELVVGMILSVWVSVRKPQLATSSVPMGHAVAIRIVVMEGDLGGAVFVCNGVSKAWVIKPESICGTLAWKECNDMDEHCEVHLQPESVAMIEKMKPFGSIMCNSL